MVIGFTKYPKIYRILYDDEPPRTDKRYLTKLEVGHLLDGEVIVEEKVDGAVSGIRWNDRPIVQCRSHVISENELDRQFKTLLNWSYQHSEKLENIPKDWMVFGEWCHRRHSVPYTDLPDFFMAFDILADGIFLDYETKIGHFNDWGLSYAPFIYIGKTDHESIRRFVGPSAFYNGQMEGVVVKNYEKQRFGKYVSQDFENILEESGHYKRAPYAENKLHGWH